MVLQEFSNYSMWAYYKQELIKFANLKIITNENFVTCGNTIIANLAAFSKALPPSHVPTVPQALAQIYLLADTEITENNTYTPSMNRFFSNYATYIDCLVPRESVSAPTQNQEAEKRLLQAEITAANDKYNLELNKALAAWHLKCKESPNEYAAFPIFLDRSSWGHILENKNSIILALNSQINNLLFEIYGAAFELISVNKQIVDTIRTTMQGNTIFQQFTMEISTDAGNAVKPLYNQSSLVTFSEWVDTTIKNHNQVAQIPISFELKNKKASKLSRTNSFCQTSLDTDFFFFSGKKENDEFVKKINIDTAHEDFLIQFQFDDITSVQVSQGPWYQSDLMYDFKNPKNLSIATSLIIGMYPVINLSMDSESFNKSLAAYHSLGGFGIGPFWTSATFNEKTSAPHMIAKWNKSSNTVSLVLGSPVPIIIIGMEVISLPNR